ncbi:hypothetical protein MKW98_005252 [Papaver atlanticum]|uniref:Uncharacterized protein n=1 Tax=Papaver atlanticum TaxID=357466 RepID=A0AAD4RWT3_9MAGN|nr:hypothetical protein MKW98_005252 [Papaver atlanticum]
MVMTLNGACSLLESVLLVDSNSRSSNVDSGQIQRPIWKSTNNFPLLSRFLSSIEIEISLQFMKHWSDGV